MKYWYLIVFVLIMVACETPSKPDPKLPTTRSTRHIVSVSPPKKDNKDTRVREYRYFFRNFNDLSAQFNVKLTLKVAVVPFGKEQESYYMAQQFWTMAVYSKSDSLTAYVSQYFEGMHWEQRYWKNVKSMETHVRDSANLDHYYDILVVGDFNFDSLSDIALVNNFPPTGSAIPSYDFYMQTSSGKFRRDDSFPGLLPIKSDPVRRTFQISYPSSSCLTLKYYKVDASGRCRQLKVVEKCQ